MRTRTKLTDWGVGGLVRVLAAPVVWIFIGQQIAEALAPYPRPGARFPPAWALTLASFQPVIGLALLIVGRVFVTDLPPPPTLPEPAETYVPGSIADLLRERRRP